MLFLRSIAVYATLCDTTGEDRGAGGIGDQASAMMSG
jgi:hypothetical protein